MASPHAQSGDICVNVPAMRLGAAALLVALALVLLIRSSDRTPHSSPAGAGVGRSSRQTRAPRPPEHFAIAELALRLPEALQDLAAAPAGGGRAVLLGGLNAADTSTAAVSVVDGGGVIAGARLPEAQHDAQAATLGGRVYVFGGGEFASYAHILSYDPATESVTQAGSLPTPTSDAGVGTIAGTAYVVGGYDGRRALAAIVAWRPGERARVVGHLPYGLRYAAVAASGAQLLIAGGSRGEAATRGLMSFEPATRKLRRLGDLPDPLTHAAAVALDHYVYIFGGRLPASGALGSAPGALSSAILAASPMTGRVVRVGHLPQPLSDAAALRMAGRVWLVGGQSLRGAVASVTRLTPILP